MARSPYVLSIRKAYVPAVGTLIGWWWWHTYIQHLGYSSETPTFYKNDLAMRLTANETGGKPIAVLLQSISGVRTIIPLVAFTTSMEERERCYSFSLSHTTRSRPHETDPQNGFLKKIRLLIGSRGIPEISRFPQFTNSAMKITCRRIRC
jgi:hypothetical protein